MDWLEIAQNLPLGKKTYTTCPECGREKKAVVSHDARGYSLYCFRGCTPLFERKGTQTLEQLRRIQELNDAASKFQDRAIELPKDFTESIPPEGKLWLYRASISESTWKQFRIGYSPSMCRVILPVYSRSGDLLWYQARAMLEGQKPKYLQPDRERSTVMFQAYSSRGDLQRAVIVEDILSAIRVGKHIDTYSLLGTKITTGQAAELSKYNRVTIWLDGDIAGQRGAYKIKKSLGLVTQVDVLRTEHDPKSYTDTELLEFLNG